MLSGRHTINYGSPFFFWTNFSVSFFYLNSGCLLLCFDSHHPERMVELLWRKAPPYWVQTGVATPSLPPACTDRRTALVRAGWRLAKLSQGLRFLHSGSFLLPQVPFPWLLLARGNLGHLVAVQQSVGSSVELSVALTFWRKRIQACCLRLPWLRYRVNMSIISIKQWISEQKLARG